MNAKRVQKELAEAAEIIKQQQEVLVGFNTKLKNKLFLLTILTSRVTPTGPRAEIFRALIQLNKFEVLRGSTYEVRCKILGVDKKKFRHLLSDEETGIPLENVVKVEPICDAHVMSEIINRSKV